MQRKKEDIIVAIIIIVITTICYFVFDNSKMGYSKDSAIYTHFTYVFAHASILHLALNNYVIYRSINRKILPLKELVIVPMIIAILASFVSACTLPTVGISGFIFAIVGFSYALRPTRLNTLFMVSCFCITAISPINTLLHLTCFLMGVAYMIIRKKWQQKKI